MSPSAGKTSTRRIVAGREIVFDDEGFFWDFSLWDESVAEALATEAGLESLTKAHWRVIRFLREFYESNARSPRNRQIREGTGISLMKMESMFPNGIKYGARRLAGLPNPKSCM